MSVRACSWKFVISVIFPDLASVFLLLLMHFCPGLCHKGLEGSEGRLGVGHTLDKRRTLQGNVCKAPSKHQNYNHICVVRHSQKTFYSQHIKLKMAALKAD